MIVLNNKRLKQLNNINILVYNVYKKSTNTVHSR